MVRAIRATAVAVLLSVAALAAAVTDVGTPRPVILAAL
jgi:hypothetical protein